MPPYAGKTAVVTGGATGIGKELARALVGEGMRVVIASTNAERLSAAAAELCVDGGIVRPIICDVSDRAAVRALATFVDDEFGGTDLLCANAGGSTSGPILDHGDADWDWVIDVVFRGVVHCVQAFYPAMAARGLGQILITGSHMGFSPDRVLHQGPYVAAKGGVHALALTLRPEAAKHGVGVSLLAPAMTPTDIGTEPQRSRPSRYGQPLDSVALEVREGAVKPSADYPRALSAQEVAARAIAGLKADKAIIATHAAMIPVIEEFTGRIVEAYHDASNYP